MLSVDQIDVAVQESRFKILSILAGSEAKQLRIGDLLKQSGFSHSKLHYHVRVLADAGLVQCVSVYVRFTKLGLQAVQ